MSVLVYVENTEGKFKKSAFEVVSYGKSVADSLGQDLIALSIGDVDENELNSLATYGAKTVVSVEKEDLKNFINQAYASVIAEVAESKNAKTIILSNSFSGKGLAPRLSAKLKAGLADGAVSLPEISKSTFKIKKTAFSGKAFAIAEIHSDTKIIAVNPNSYQVVENPETPQVEKFSTSVEGKNLGTIINEIVRSTEKVSLPDAEIVVSAGRGLKGPENWGMIEELADLLGAATACSKPVSDADWRPHSEHVGQTGIAVSPNLYIAIGISGAIQHLAGVSSSKTIVVINKDPEAPFFKVADYGIVGDAFEVVPRLIEAIKAHKGS